MELELSQMLILFACVFLGGLVDSIAGGGGLITLPAYYAVGIPAHMALGTNKFANSIGTLTALLRFLKEGQINIKVARWRRWARWWALLWARSLPWRWMKSISTISCWWRCR